jgi:hypothetical protein
VAADSDLCHQDAFRTRSTSWSTVRPRS